MKKQTNETTVVTIPGVIKGKEDRLMTYENHKLKKQFIFDLPATPEVCGRVCPGCYAQKAQIAYPAVMPARSRRLEVTKGKTFVDRISSELTGTKKQFNFVRIHSSGDFYSQDYIDKWAKIAKTSPNVRFYAFTKRKKDFDFSGLMKLKNVSIVDSLQFGRLNYGPIDQMRTLAAKHNTTICPDTLGDKNAVCGVTCSYCMTKEAQNKGVLFVQH